MSDPNSLKRSQKVNLKRGSFQSQAFLDDEQSQSLYRFKVGRSSQVSIELSNQSKKGSLAIELYAVKGKHRSVLKRIGKNDFQTLRPKDKRQNFSKLHASRQKGSSTHSKTVSLSKGIYYLRVKQIKNEVQYTLNLTSDRLPSPNPSSPNTSSNSATSSGSSSGTRNGTPVNDWFGQNLSDPDLRTTARDRFSDQTLDRMDMLALFDSAKDNDTVDSVELSDLQTLITHHNQLGMADHVRVLADKVVNGSNQNTYYQGESLGNLATGSTAEHLDALVDKWFMGGDRPAAPEGYTMTYAKATGSLFGTDNTPHLTDIRQGYLADCYFLAGLAANVLYQPETIQNMFIDNGDGTFTVKFYGQNNGEVTTGADYVTVDRWLPTEISDGQHSGQRFADYDDGDLGLWVALAEKAYAQFAASEISFRPLPINSYDAIQYGKGFQSMAAISGRNGNLYTDMNYGPAKLGDFPSWESIRTLLDHNQPTVASTISDPSLGIRQNHEYILVAADDQTLTLYNPQGARSNPVPGEDNQGFRTLSYQDFAANFDTVEIQQIA